VEVGKRIREKREELRWTQAQLAEKVEITPNTVSMIETGHSVPSLRILLRFADALEAEPGELLSGPKVVSVPHTPITDSAPEELDKLLRFGGRDEVNRLLGAIDEEVRGLEAVVDHYNRARLYQATILRRWLQITDEHRSPESNQFKSVAEIASELGGRYKDFAREEAKTAGEQEQPSANTA
jgi:transcriptional regulator with XRE-family HTH domain